MCLSNPQKHSTKTRPLEAIIDSGSSLCCFHSDLCKPLGLKLTAGIRRSVGTVNRGSHCDGYIHPVKIWIGEHIITTKAVFSDDFPALGILGRVGFFDKFVITFDTSAQPPHMDLTWIT